MKLLLCGHGYLGQEITRVFRAAGWNVFAVSRSNPDKNQLGCGAPPSSVTDASSGSITEIPCDISDRDAVGSLAGRMARPDFIVHCASSSRGGPDAYRRVFLDGCRNLLEAFAGVPLLFTSSTSVYAQTDGSLVDEDSPAEPERETGRILLDTEALVIDHAGIVTRLAGIYGPGRSVILRRFLAGEAVIEDDGRRYLNQIHRDDAARAIHHLASPGDNRSAAEPEAPAGDRHQQTAAGNFHPSIFNLTDSRPLSQIECYTALAEMFGRPLPRAVPRDPNRKRGWTHKRVSNARLLATGWKPAFPCFLDAAPAVTRSLDCAQG